MNCVILDDILEFSPFYPPGSNWIMIKDGRYYCTQTKEYVDDPATYKIRVPNPLYEVKKYGQTQATENSFNSILFMITDKYQLRCYEQDNSAEDDEQF